MSDSPSDLFRASAPPFRPVPRTGVIFVMTEARARGYTPGDSNWANLGQGAPETGPLPGAPPRVTRLEIEPCDHEYAPVDGLPELREAVARLYNERYRVGKRSQYTAENVAICGGGRLALARVVATVGRTNVGHFLPDYTAYEELLDSFGTFVAIPTPRSSSRGFDFTVDELRREILGRGLSTLLLSNPANPTGFTLEGDALASWVATARELGCSLILDEFYSHYVYSGETPAPGSPVRTVSAARYVEEVDRDPVTILDGVTKNWRYPGFRIAWVVGPKDVVQRVTSAGSFMDGGAARPVQRGVIPLVDRSFADQEAAAIQGAFRPKRDLLVDGLAKLGIPANPSPTGGFYAWGSLEGLPAKIRRGSDFFRAALGEGLIVIPGRFFDINPGQRRPDRPSRFQGWARFSFGPEESEVARGLEKIARVIEKAR